MKGLLLKDFYMTVKYCKVIFLLDIVFIAASFFSSWSNITFLLFPVVFSGTISITLLSLDERCKWTSYSGALPYSSAQIVSTKYLLGLIVQAAIALVIFLVLLVRIGYPGGAEMNIGNAVVPVAGMFVISLVSPALCLPFCFRFGTERGRIVYFVVVGAFVALTTQFVREVTIGDKLYEYGAIIAGVLVVLYALSWIISIPLYKRRELTD